MLKLQFKDSMGRVTSVTFTKQGDVIVLSPDHGERNVNKRAYSKSSPIAKMYQNLLHNSREVESGLFQVIGAW